MENVALRKAGPADYDAINELASLLVGFRADRRASFDGVVGSPHHNLVVAEVGGAVVGYAHLMTYQDLSHGALAGELLGLVVHERFRRKGIGRALLHEICRLAEDRGVGEFHINTEPGNEIAHGLYRSLGAELVGVQFEVNLAGEAHRNHLA